MPLPGCPVPSENRGSDPPSLPVALNHHTTPFSKSQDKQTYPSPSPPGQGAESSCGEASTIVQQFPFSLPSTHPYIFRGREDTCLVILLFSYPKSSAGTKQFLIESTHLISTTTLLSNGSRSFWELTLGPQHLRQEGCFSRDREPFLRIY